jgi:hypothetical protein
MKGLPLVDLLLGGGAHRALNVGTAVEDEARPLNLAHVDQPSHGRMT